MALGGTNPTNAQISDSCTQQCEAISVPQIPLLGAFCYRHLTNDHTTGRDLGIFQREHRESVKVLSREWHGDFRRPLYTGGEGLFTLSAPHTPVRQQGELEVRSLKSQAT